MDAAEGGRTGLKKERPGILPGRFRFHRFPQTGSYLQIRCSGYTIPLEASPPLDISVVIPAYNEEKRLGGTLERILSYVAEAGHDAEILVVDDGSIPLPAVDLVLPDRPVFLSKGILGDLRAGFKSR